MLTSVKSASKMEQEILIYLAKMADAYSSAMRGKKIPDNLYELCLTNLVNYLQKSKCDRNVLTGLPDSVLMDVYYKVSYAILVRFLIDKKQRTEGIPLLLSDPVSGSDNMVSVARLDRSQWRYCLVRFG